METQVTIEMQKKLIQRLDTLKAMSFMELTSLPEYADTEEEANTKQFTLATWRKEIDQETVQLVVQAYKHYLLGIGTMMAEGFRKNQAGDLLKVPENEILEYK